MFHSGHADKARSSPSQLGRATLIGFSHNTHAACMQHENSRLFLEFPVHFPYRLGETYYRLLRAWTHIFVLISLCFARHETVTRAEERHCIVTYCQPLTQAKLRKSGSCMFAAG